MAARGNRIVHINQLNPMVSIVNIMGGEDDERMDGREGRVITVEPITVEIMVRFVVDTGAEHNILRVFPRVSERSYVLCLLRSIVLVLCLSVELRQLCSVHGACAKWKKMMMRRRRMMENVPV